MSWHQTAASGDQNGFVVVEAMLGASRSDRPLTKSADALIERLSTLMGNAAAEVMQMLRERLTVLMEREDRLETRTVEWPWKPEGEKWVVKSARLRFPVDAERAQRVRDLLAQPTKPYGYTNAYRFTNIEEHADAQGRFWVTAELARGEWKERETRKGKAVTHALSVIQATTGLQQLLAGYLMAPSLLALPRLLRAGDCQEAAQQITSLFGQLESTKVKGEVAFPTIEDRDPVRRRAAYEAAIDALVSDVRPLRRVRARDKVPGKYAADDKRGDRLVVDDERWLAVTRSPDPHPIPLFFADSKSVRIQQGEARFDAGISKADRHRGRLVPNEWVRDSRPERVRRNGSTGMRAFYALLPVLDTDDPEILRILAERDRRKAASKSRGRGLRHEMQNVSLLAGVTNRPREQDLRLPLSFDRRCFERLLKRTDIEVAWAKVVKKDDGWRLQLTLRVPYANPVGVRRVLGVTFGLDAIASWVLVDESGTVLEKGQLSPNPQIAEFIAQKRELEWDQQKGRWIGSRSFAARLEAIAHRVSNHVVKLASEHGAVLAVHDISYVVKSGPDSESNVLFTAWNYGQLRRMIGYKAPLAGRGEPMYVSGYLVQLTCPSCGAIRGRDEPKDKATTWRSGEMLYCRACRYEGVPTWLDNALRVAEQGRLLWRMRWDKEDSQGT